MKIGTTGLSSYQKPAFSSLALAESGDWVWIDEIQRIPELLNEVHYGIEKLKLKFALSGSSARKLRKAGTLPLIYSAPSKKQQLQAYVHSYLREEVQAEGLVRDLPAFAQFLKVASLLHGCELSMSSVARDVGVKRPTVENYFSILE